MPRPEHLNRLYAHYLKTRLRDARQLAQDLVPRLPHPAARVLDVGCGEGALSLAFAERGATVVAFDNVMDHLVNTREATSGQRVGLVHADAGAMPFAPESFDVILMNDFLEHVDNPGDVLADAARILRPGGFAFIATTNRSSVVTALTDPHYNVPFISLMPRRLAAWYVTRATKVSAEYGVGMYFFGGQLRRLIRAAGLDPREVPTPYAEKIRSGALSAAPGRYLLALALRRDSIREALARFSGTWLFRYFIQPGWVFLALKLPSES